MKTLTELSGSVIRTAAAAIADAKRSLPKEEKPADTTPTEAAPPVEASPEAAGEAVSEPKAAAPEPAAPSAQGEGETDAVKAALDEAVAKATGFSGDRLAMLRAAVGVVGRRAEDVRLVRVFGVEEQLRGAHVVGEHQYVVDFFPATMKQVAGSPKDERGRGGGKRGGRPGGGGDRGAKGASTGGFSMDSLREDRKNERGGRPGGGRRPPGRGGPPGAGGPRTPAGGEPKK
jgi:hypothetical protein